MKKSDHMQVLSIKLPPLLLEAVKRAAALPPGQTPSAYVRRLIEHTLARKRTT